jgi:hypothetical protein
MIDASGRPEADTIDFSGQHFRDDLINVGVGQVFGMT